MTFKIALVGAPCAGKSTTASGVFYKCKERNISVELIQEYAREAINKGWKIKNIAEQLLIHENQKEKEDIVPDSTKVMITDSPLFLSFYYGIANSNGSDEHVLVHLYKQFLQDIKNYDYIIFLNRTKNYINDGTRIQTEEESDKIAQHLKALLEMHNVTFEEMEGDDKAVEKIMWKIEQNIIINVMEDSLKDFDWNSTTRSCNPSDYKLFTNTIGGRI